MRIAVMASIAASLAACTASQPPATAAADAARPIAEIAGRIAGPAQRCVTIEQSQSLRVADRNTLLYRSGRTIWVNRVEGNCGSFSQWDVIVTEPIGTQYCQGDLVRSFDPVSKIPGPTCRMGEFVPYTRPN
jgi:hypothetical protein